MKRIHLLFVTLKRPEWLGVILGLVCTVIIFLTTYIHLPFFSSFIEQLNFKIYDQILNANWHPHKPIPRVVIIDINEDSIHKEGRWPWRRDKIAKLLDKLKKDGVVTIGMDIVMSDAEPNYATGLKKKLSELNLGSSNSEKSLFTTLTKIAPKVDSDRILALSLEDHTVVLGFLFHNDIFVQKGKLPVSLTNPEGKPFDGSEYASLHFKSYNGSIPLLVDTAAQSGFVTNIPDSDGAIRQALLLAQFDKKLYPSMALATAMNYLLVKHISLVREGNKLAGIQLDGTFVPTNAHGQILVPYWGKPGTLDYYSATDVLQNKVKEKDLQGSIAIIGSTMPLLSDLHETPLSLTFPGVEIVGNIIQGIVSQQLIVEFDWHTVQGSLYLILFGLFFSILFPFISINWALLISFCTVLLLLAGAVLLFVQESLYVASATLITLILLLIIVNYSYSFILERRQKKQISYLFGQYVPEDYLKELLEHPDQFNMEGQTRNMTVLFADIRGFTSISEHLDAAGVKRLLNTFFTPITEIIFNNRGTIDKYVGDMIVAFWGAPIEDPEHANHAITSALSIFDNLDKINQVMVKNKLPPVQIGIGLASGLMNVGDMGSEFRRAYTVLGDTVNLASRLQDLTKFYKVDILVNDATKEEHQEVLWRAIDRVTVKGRKKPLTIYQPLCSISEASQELLEEVSEYHEALQTYYAQEWNEAKKRFDALKRVNPDCYLYQLYLDRIRSFQDQSPPTDWDGVYTHLQK